ncbi:EpsG family protein [Sphingorhabdus soli]|uniref:EpsG family protein n=1 Tax=Flavisphingopyxis soli TaxID=2601267 RepID=A0A5C6UMS7_9SPHN|nr:EpsG family protein [Sphingorhabdus soli]TXC74249.1 EpsG family protein [Sphingorhabdus soli]
MLIYWLLLALPAFLALVGLRRQEASTRGGTSRAQSNTVFIGGFLMVVFWVFYNLISGLRYQVGGDWFAYINMIDRVREDNFLEALFETDVGFGMTTWVMTRLGLGIGVMNFICSGILSLGVLRLARRTQHPWLAITAAVPYLLIVVGMGYVRQAAAIGFILFAINALIDKRSGVAFVYLVMATAFHVSALIMVPFLAVAYVRNLPWTIVIMFILAVAGYFLLSGTERFEQVQDGYIDAGYASSGALVRILMNVGPAIVFLYVKDRLPVSLLEKKIWMLISMASIGLAVILPLSPSSTVVDRLGLLFSPIQIYVFGYLPQALNIPLRRSGLMIMAVVAYCVTIQLIWLNFADNAGAWVPYYSVLSGT